MSDNRGKRAVRQRAALQQGLPKRNHAHGHSANDQCNVDDNVAPYCIIDLEVQHTADTALGLAEDHRHRKTSHKGSHYALLSPAPWWDYSTIPPFGGRAHAYASIFKDVPVGTGPRPRRVCRQWGFCSRGIGVFVQEFYGGGRRPSDGGQVPGTLGYSYDPNSPDARVIQKLPSTVVVLSDHTCSRTLYQ
eukprot:COSAG02_NODE_1293_length_13410_cov_13.392004_15_plen_190_part_00